jgi:hypothetical protein
MVTENSDSYFKMEGLLLQEVEEKKRIVEQRAQQRLMKMQKQRSLLNGELSLRWFLEHNALPYCQQ